MEVIASNKGGLKVIFEGHMYTKVFEGKTSILWSVFGVLMGAREQLKQISTKGNRHLKFSSLSICTIFANIFLI